nr:glycosyltransferase [Sphingomonas sp. Ant H11]
MIEALAAGLPIIATDCCCSMADLLGHGTLGQLVPTGDAAALAQAMMTLAPDSARPLPHAAPPPRPSRSKVLLTNIWA